jgi:putative hydrolase
VFSFHTTYEDKSIWIQALNTAVQNPHVDVIGHLAPESTFDLNNDELSDLASFISSSRKIIEINAKYHRSPLR